MTRRMYPCLLLALSAGNMAFAQTLGRISGTLITEDGTSPGACQRF